MDIFTVSTLIVSLCLFLFGMNVMGDSLERAAGNFLRSIPGKLTSRRTMGFGCFHGLRLLAPLRQNIFSLQRSRAGLSRIFPADSGRLISR